MCKTQTLHIRVVLVESKTRTDRRLSQKELFHYAEDISYVSVVSSPLPSPPSPQQQPPAAPQATVSPRSPETEFLQLCIFQLRKLLNEKLLCVKWQLIKDVNLIQNA